MTRTMAHDDANRDQFGRLMGAALAEAVANLTEDERDMLGMIDMEEDGVMAADAMSASEQRMAASLARRGLLLRRVERDDDGARVVVFERHAEAVALLMDF